MEWLANRIPDPSTRQPLTKQTFWTIVAPALLLYNGTAFLALLPKTRIIRIALLPVTIWTAFRAATTIDVTSGYDEPGLNFLNYGLCLAMVIIVMRTLEWTFRSKPMKRVAIEKSDVKTSGAGKSAPEERSFGSILMDSVELTGNLRGLGWNWSHGLYVPAETRPTTSITSFSLATFASFLQHFILADLCQYTVQYWNPPAGSVTGGTIIDPTLSLLPRYTQAFAITLIGGLCIYSNIQVFYELWTLISILVLRQSPAMWPPLFHAPWKCTSLAAFWAKGWHQVFRSPFITLGAKPLSLLVGRVGGVMGAFLVSGILHDFGMWGLGRGTDFRRVGVPFLMMGVGIILENIWLKVSGRRVGGVAGWMWMMAWMVLWCHFLVDAWCRRGLVGSKFVPDRFRPSHILLSYITD